MRLRVRVTPRARRASVTGDGEGGLRVHVAAPAVDGRATDAALKAVAAALGVRPGQVTLVSGATSRAKVVEVDGVSDSDVRARLAALGEPAVPPG